MQSTKSNKRENKKNYILIENKLNKIKTYIHITNVLFIICIFTLHTVNVWADDKDKTQRQVFVYEEYLDPIFEKLYNLENQGKSKVNIVHIGDSHIQADLLTNHIRNTLQSHFGNGGYGFTFPYRLVRTNGTDIIKYKSDATWKSRLNVYPVSNQVEIGLSGIGFYTFDRNFSLELNVRPEYSFNSLKILYSTISPQYNISSSEDEQNNANNSFDISASDEYFIHNIKRGDYLSLLANKYKTTVQEIKKINGLKGDLIQAGNYIRIPNTPNNNVKKTTKFKKTQTQLDTYPYYSEYISEEPLENAIIFSKDGFSQHNIDGFVIENDKPGLIYHSIGVNGAKISDFNKYPLFFTQLSILHPDLIIISFGTNESYLKLSVNGYIKNLKTMCENIRKDNPNVSILIFTPPPSLVRQTMENPLVGKYSTALLEDKTLDVAVWDFYKKMGGEEGIKSNGKYVHLISKDKIHYTINGYKVQAEMFSSDFMKAYEEFKKRKTN